MAKITIQLEDWDLTDPVVHAAYVDLIGALQGVEERQRARWANEIESQARAMGVDPTTMGVTMGAVPLRPLGTPFARPLGRASMAAPPMPMPIVPPFPPMNPADKCECDECRPPQGALSDEDLKNLGLDPSSTNGA